MTHATQDDARMRTGVPGLDQLLGGGLLSRRSVLLKGAPGSGKTTLGVQMLVAGATTYGEPGALLSFEQQPAQFFDDAARLGWDLRSLAESNRIKSMFVAPEQILQSEGRQTHQLLVELTDMAEDFGVRRVLIDSISHLEPLLGSDQMRANLLKFINALKTMGLTPILTSELSSQGGLLGLEAYLVDTVLLMEQSTGESTVPAGRWIQVFKGRGLNHLSGRHPFEIGPGGVTVYPHCYPAEVLPAVEATSPGHADIPAPPVDLDTGVEGLNALLAGGYTPGSIVMVAGPSGTFKTSLAAHFLLAGGAPGLWITFQEDRAALARRYHGVGGVVEVMEVVAGRQPVEKLFRLAADRIDAVGARRVAIDGAMELTVGLESDRARAEAIRWFLRNMRALGVTTLLTQQLSRVTAGNPMTSIDWPEHADTIIYLGLVEIESRLERVISVLKHRGGPALGDLRAIAPTADGGLCVSDRFVGLSGVLGGTPLGRRKARIEEIFQPLYFIRDFLALARNPKMDPSKRDGVLTNLSSETQRLIDLLGKYFDQPLAPPTEEARGEDKPGGDRS